MKQLWSLIKSDIYLHMQMMWLKRLDRANKKYQRIQRKLNLHLDFMRELWKQYKKNFKEEEKGS